MTENYIFESGMQRENINNGYLGIGQPSDVSGIVLFLMSDRAEKISGQDFLIDGGSYVENIGNGSHIAERNI